MVNYKVLASNLVYQMLRTKPQGVATLANADERLYKSLVIDRLSQRSYVRSQPSKYCIDGKLVELPITYHASEQWWYTGFAKLVRAPEQYDPSKGESHEIEFEIPDHSEIILRSFAKQLGANYDNNFVTGWMIGNALSQWYDVKNPVICRTTESLLPVGEYEFEVSMFNYVETDLDPSPRTIKYDTSEGGYLEFECEKRFHRWVRTQNVKVLVTSAKSHDSSESSQSHSKGKRAKDKLSNSNKQSNPAQMGR